MVFGVDGYNRNERLSEFMYADANEDSMTTNHKSNSMLRNIRRTVLPNGLTVLSEVMPQIRSVSAGVWIRTGSRHELPEVNGISHFAEHMVFKGTTNRTAEQIAREVDSMGGNLDAFTAKECVCFNVKVLDEQLPGAMDVLSDLVMNPACHAEDVKKERSVILEEIKMDEDNPDYLVHELFVQNFWKDHPLGRPILGTQKTVRNFDPALLFDFYHDRFRAGNMVISAAGSLDHDDFLAMVTDRFGGLERGTSDLLEAVPEASSRFIQRNKKSLEQVQLCIGVPSYSICAEHPAGRRDELTALPERTREAGTGVFHLQRPEPLPRHGMPDGVRRHQPRQRSEGAGQRVERIPQPARAGRGGRGAEPLQGAAEGQPDAEPGVQHGAHEQPGTAGDLLRPAAWDGRDYGAH
jgi:hypothetical protein